jgi:hypothetical protein
MGVRRGRLIETFRPRASDQVPPDRERHACAWESLWGKDFADAHVEFESGLAGLYDYKTAWKWALSIGKEQRASRFAEIVRSNRR